MKPRKHLLEKALYNGLVLPIGTVLTYAAIPFHPKIRCALRGRRHLRERWAAAGEASSSSPVWFHVSSVGEFEQARPVISGIKKKFPKIPVVLSFSSPSGIHYARRKEKEAENSNMIFIDYLPIDFSRNIRFCLNALRPRLLVLVKFDLWPNLIWEAGASGVPSILIDATLSQSSLRQTYPGRFFYRSLYEEIDRILAISRADAARFKTCVPEHRGIQVTGDTRFDRVMERKRQMDGAPFELEKNGKTIIVAGSTWPADESRLLPALSRLLREEEEMTLVVAPHEPTRERVSGLKRWAAKNSLAGATVREIDAEPEARVIIVDTVGVLAEVYSLGDIAYVGGSFSTGVHNVIEPAIMGIPVLLGPVHENAYEAGELLKIGAAIEVQSQEEIYDSLRYMVADCKKRRSMGKRAKAYVESKLGASEICLEVISSYI